MAQDTEYKLAGKRMAEMRKTVPYAVAARYESKLHRLVVTLNNHLEIAINPEQIQTLQGRSASTLKAIEISPAGYSLFFPAIDDGIYLPGILQGIFGTKKWMDTQRSERGTKALSASRRVGVPGEQALRQTGQFS